MAKQKSTGNCKNLPAGMPETIKAKDLLICLTITRKEANEPSDFLNRIL